MAFTLAHFSDPHLPPLPKPRLKELAGKRVLGYLNWTRNRHKYYRREVLDALVRDLQAQSARPHRGDRRSRQSCAACGICARRRRGCAAWARRISVTAIPGNHDAYVRATRHRFVESFGEYLRGDEPAGQAFPFLRRRGPVALIGLSSAVPTAPFMATGTLGAAQIEALERILVSLSTEQVFRVLLVHHPLRSDSRPKRLTDSAALIALLRKHGVELILHGHDHIHSTMWFDGPDRKIPSIGVPAASALARGRHPAAAYNLYKIERDGNAWRCEQVSRGIDGNLQVSEIGRTRLI